MLWIVDTWCFSFFFFLNKLQKKQFQIVCLYAEMLYDLVYFFSPRYTPKSKVIRVPKYTKIDHQVSTLKLLLIEEILHQLIGGLSHFLQRFSTSQVVVWDFFHQQYQCRCLFKFNPPFGEFLVPTYLGSTHHPGFQSSPGLLHL